MLRKFLRNRRRLRIGLCRNCGYDIRATPNRCPECGAVASARCVLYYISAQSESIRLTKGVVTMQLSRMGLTPLALICLISLACSSGAKNPQPAPQARAVPQQAAPKTAENQQQIQAMQAELAAREAKIRELEAARNQQPPSIKNAATDPAIAGLATSFDKAKRELTVTLQSDVLFLPGSADLKPESKAALDKVVAAIKKDYASKKIRVQGHTDKDPIVHSSQKWIDNMDLSQNRAASVARYLKTKGVEMKNVVTLGFGDTQPKPTKEKSRRVEIVVVTD